MHLPRKSIERFIEIYRQDYGCDLDYAEAEVLALAFYNQMNAVYKPIPRGLTDKQ